MSNSSIKNEDISYKVHETLKDRQINIDYNPEKNEYKPWYKLKFKVEYNDEIRCSNVNLFRRKIKIRSLGNLEKAILGLLHEKTHVDVAPIETPLITLAGCGIFNYMGNSIKGGIVAIGFALIYHKLIGDLAIEAITHIKYNSSVLFSLKW